MYLHSTHEDPEANEDKWVLKLMCCVKRQSQGLNSHLLPLNRSDYHGKKWTESLETSV